MEIAALSLALLALVAAILARGKAAGLEAKIEEARSDARRRAENTLEESKAEVETLRRMLARIAAGAKLSPQMIAEGRLWHEVGTQEAVVMVTVGGVRVVDVRTPQETAAGMIPGALRIPVDEIEQRMKELPRDGRRTLVYCAGGSRSAAACEFLSRQGYEELYNLEGGFQSWSGPRAKP